ncbi:non-ribosomal peptide synthetase/MFS transporter [Amycolatopsis sp. BJA-103]|uniref:non-ribosomal peptide synthetase/MFS transporter n=1 Tax=Amycolatopsis sp. BJA-103 TaxID=1911175 RepID=UPI000C75F488|nr:non-ribosomal peptide synthetase/MFS transporter [Amycolatopsis sp. BJA-103]AUI59560.1 non-ribosomal peptide synthetase [Amycolatopsis sp. BJA-103]PNE16994.1 non-ribosomal peptide synthetase [Amycolatopsis sp. BJA-103]
MTRTHEPPLSTVEGDVWSSVAAQAVRTPHAVALADTDGELDYEALVGMAAGTADRLAEAGVRPGDLVGIRLPRGRDAIVAILAVLRAGAGYVPLDPAYPEARLAMMVEETRPSALITGDGVSPLEGGVPRQDPAYVIFTSGSTGRPKGVLIGRRSLRDFTGAFADRFAFAPGDRILQFASLSFDTSVEEIFCPLIRGATLVLRDDDMISRPDLFFERCGALGITVLDLPTAYWHELVAALDRGETSVPVGVRCVIIGGETARPDAVRRWQAAVGGVTRLFNSYGPTETTVGATATDVTEWSGDVVPIGVPHPGVTCRIGDDGELLIGGIGVAEGYLNRPELTAERFVTTPGHGREYRTGDRVRWSDDGQLEFLGRLDDQVKIRGHRVEPAEVEAALRQLDGVTDAVVLVDDKTGRARLIGHLVTGTTDLAAVRNALGDVLPAHLIPAVLLRHPRFPLTPQGKIDKTALAAEVPPEHGHDSALTADERSAAALFEEILGGAVTGTADDFLSLGGDSLDAVRLIAALRVRHGAELTLTRWYADPTVAALAEVIAGATGATETTVAGLAEGVPHPLSPMQRDYWIAEQLCAELPVYTLGIRYRWAEAVDVAALTAALAELSRRHPLLRARFPDDGTEPSMVIEPAATIPLTLGEPDRDGIDYRHGPVAHAFLDEDELVLIVHHLAFDGWSAGVLGQELAALYSGADPAPAVPVPDLAARAARAKADRPLVSYWRDRFDGADLDLELPADRPRPAARTYAAERVTRRIDPALLDRLRSYAGEQRASLFMVVLAGLQTVLRRYTGHTDVTVLSPVAGRSAGELASLIGPALNVLPLRGDVTGEPSFAELVARVRDAVLGDLDHQELALPDLVTALAGAKRLSPVMLTVHNTPAPGDPLLRYTGELPPSATMVDLAIGLDFPADGAALNADYATELFEGARIEAILDHLLTLLDAATSGTSTPITRLPMLTDVERGRIVDDWNDIVAPVPDAIAVHQLFERHALATPDAPALTVGRDTVSYAELNHRANRLARRLRDEGVRPGHRVAITLDRGTALFTAMWAVLKAGGAYVPLDPAYPADRLEYMLTDSGPTVVIDADYLVGELPADGTDLPPVTTSDDPAYVIYTSGSTGRPKGVVVTHGNLVHAAGMWQQAYRLRPEWTYLQAASFSFDMFVGETLRAHLSGGRLVVAPRETLLDPADLLALMKTERVNCSELVPAVLRALLDHTERGGQDLGFVDLLIGGGEKWHVKEFRLARQLVGPGNRVVNSYGVTEVTVDNVCFEGSVDHLADDAPLPIGRPFPNNRVYVLDAHRQPVPAGVVGELYLGGLGVVPGYHERPGLTADRFVPDPFAPGARMYRTGDSARFHLDGTVDFLGRLDDQVKVNGHRIELGEVEAALGALPGVVACAAAPHGSQLVGYVVTRDGSDADEAVYRETLAAGLPPQMVPARILTLPALPLSPNGKLDRRALPAPSGGGPRSTGTVARTDTEKRIAAAWSDVLGVTDPGIDDSFFALGGDSFAALKVVRRIEPSPSLVELYQHATIRRLAAHLDARSRAEPTERRLLHRLTATDADPARGGRTVVAVPYSGGSAVAYQPLADALPAGWALHAAELPGHDRSRSDEELEPIDVVSGRIVEELRSIDGPILLYGHCLGVALTVEVARRAEAAGLPVAGVALGAGFPTARLPGRFFDWIYRHVPVDRFTSDREYLAYLRARGGFTDLDDDGQKAFVLRNVRHDARDAEEYFTAAYRGSFEPLKAPVLTVVGARDRVTEHYQERRQEWRHFTEGDVGLAVLPHAGHFFLKSHAEPLAEALVEFVSERPAAEEPAPVVSAEPDLRKFAVVAFGQLLSMVGSGLSTLVLSIWVFQQTGSITSFALVSAIGLLPGIVAGPLAGAVADRWDRRKVMLVSDSMAGLSMAALAFLMLSDGLHLWHVYLAVTVTSVAGAFQRPAYLAAVAQLVPKRYLGHAGGIGQLGVGVGLVFSPMLGAALIGPIGISGVLLVDMGTFAAGALTLLFVRFPNLLFRRREENFRTEIRTGWQFITRRPGLRAALRFFVVDHVFYTLGFAVITPMLLVEQPASVLGMALGAGGVGALTGSVVMGLWGGTTRRSHGMLIAMGVGSVAMILVGLTTSPALIIAGMFLVGFGESLADGHWIAIIQGKVNLELQGRVLSLFITLMMLTMPLGYLVVGPLAERFVQPLLDSPGRGLALLIVLSGLLQLAWAVRGWLNPRLRLIEDELPDAVPPANIGTRDDLQREADELLAAHNR